MQGTCKSAGMEVGRVGIVYRVWEVRFARAAS